MSLVKTIWYFWWGNNPQYHHNITNFEVTHIGDFSTTVSLIGSSVGKDAYLNIYGYGTNWNCLLMWPNISVYHWSILSSEMWYQVFLWALVSSILVHFVAAAIAFGRLRKHKYGRFIPLVILLMGILSPLTGGVITSL